MELKKFKVLWERPRRKPALVWNIFRGFLLGLLLVDIVKGQFTDVARKLPLPPPPLSSSSSSSSTEYKNVSSIWNRDNRDISQASSSGLTSRQYEDKEIRDKADPDINWHSPNPFAPQGNSRPVSEYYDPSIYSRLNPSNPSGLPPSGQSPSGSSGQSQNQVPFQSTVDRDRELNLARFNPQLSQQPQQPLTPLRESEFPFNPPRSSGEVEVNNDIYGRNRLPLNPINTYDSRDSTSWQRVNQSTLGQTGAGYFGFNKPFPSPRENLINQGQGPTVHQGQNPNLFGDRDTNFRGNYPLPPGGGDPASYPGGRENYPGFPRTYPNASYPEQYPIPRSRYPFLQQEGANTTWNMPQGTDFRGPGSGGRAGTSGDERSPLPDPYHPTLNINRDPDKERELNRGPFLNPDSKYPIDPSRTYLGGREPTGFNPAVAGGGAYPGIGPNYPGPGRTTPFVNVPGGAIPPGYNIRGNIPPGSFDPGWPYKNVWNEFWSTTTFRPLAPGVLGRWRPELQGQQRPEDINQVPYPVYVTTSYGRVQGFKVKMYDGPWVPLPARPGIVSVDKVKATVTAFVGIPYSRAPIDEGRFRPPRDHPGWQLHQAVEFGPACPQPSRFFGYTAGIVEVDEDCLYLTVLSPDVGSGVEGSPFPVLFYIHDGDFIHGASNQSPLHQLAAWYNVVVVSVNFRLGSIGFLSTADEHSPGNYGMLDLAMALKWVHQNIRSFNGDPDRITLVGLGSGAGAAGLLMLSPKTRHFVKNVVALEGAPTADWAAIVDRYRLQNTTELYAYKMGCWDEYDTTSWKIVQCLRTRSWQELANLELEPDVGTFAWAPAVDYGFKVPKDDYYNNWKEEDWHFLPDTPRNLLRSGEYPYVKYMTGFSRQSAADILFANKTLPNHIVNREWFDQMIWKWVKQYNYTLNPEGVFAAVRYAYTYYPDPYNTTHLREEYIDFLSDALYRSPVDETVKLLLARGIQVHQYLLNYTLEGLHLPFWREVPRDLSYYMLTGAPFMDPEFFPERLRVDRMAWTEGDRNMSNFLMSSIANMAHYGHPTPKEVLGIFWERATPSEIKYLSLNGTNNSTIQRNYRQRELTFWSEYMPSVVGHLVATYPPTTEFWWEPNEPLQIAFWSVSGICLLLLVMLVACCLLWRTAKHQRDRIYDDLGLGHGTIGMGPLSMGGDEISDYAASVKTADSGDSGVKLHSYHPDPSMTSMTPQHGLQSKPTSMSMQLFTTQTHPQRPSVGLSQPHLGPPSSHPGHGGRERDKFPVPMKRSIRSDTPQTQV